MNQRPKSVLFVSHDASRTGAPIYLLRFLRWLREHRRIRFQVLVISPGELLNDFASVATTFVLEPESPLDRVLRRLTFPPRDNRHHLSQLQSRLSDCNIGLIFSNTIATGKALDYLSFLDCPVICNVHELENMIQSCDRDGLRLVTKHASSYVAVSNAVKRNLAANHGIPEDAIQVIHGFVPTGSGTVSAPSSAREQVRYELNIPMEAKLVCACGSIEPRKGPDLFLQVAHKVAQLRTGVPVHFVWVGGNKDSVKTMRKQAQAMSLERMVHFIGRRRDAQPYYEATDVLLLPSREDPFPLVMLEAALQGRPIICFDRSGGAPEFVQNDAGFIVPGFDVDAMAARLALLLTSAEMCRAMGEAGRRRVLSSHDINTSAPQVAAIIQDALLSAGMSGPSETTAAISGKS
jgi:glycosyltransferase involved in cell wall biosynthesis